MGRDGKHAISLALVALLALAAPLAAGCSEEDDESPAEKVAAAAAEKEGAETEENEELDSCAVLTEKMVRDTLGVSDEAKLEQSVFDIAHHKCTYKWEKPNADEIRAQIEKKQKDNIAEMMRQMRKGKKAQGMLDMVTDLPSVNNEVSLTLTSFEFDDAAAAQKRFQQNVEMLGKGIKQKVKTKNVDEEVTFQAKSEPVEGVGDLAAWSDRLHQLSVVEGTQIFHVYVSIHEDEQKNLADAKKLAAEVVDAL